MAALSKRTRREEFHFYHAFVYHPRLSLAFASNGYTSATSLTTQIWVLEWEFTGISLQMHDYPKEVDIPVPCQERLQTGNTEEVAQSTQTSNGSAVE
jgi:hypothetical protein